MNEQLHSYDNNNYFPYDGFEWCNVKCENDLDYVQPYMPGDNLSIQWKMPYGYFMGFWAMVQGSYHHMDIITGDLTEIIIPGEEISITVM